MKNTDKKKIVCSFLIGSLLLPGLAAEAGVLKGKKSSIEKHWSMGSMVELRDKGSIKGYPDGSMKPEKKMTRAEFYSMVNQMYGFEYEGGKKKWAEKEYDVAKSYGYLESIVDKEKLDINGNITREEVAQVMAGLFNIVGGDKAGTSLKDIGEVSSSYQESVRGLIENKYINGYGDNTFKPKKEITRGEVSTIVNKLVGKIYREAGEYRENVRGNIIVAGDNISLKNIEVDGNIYILNKAKIKSIKLDGVKAKGDIYVLKEDTSGIELRNMEIDAFKTIDGKKLVKQGEKDGDKTPSTVVGGSTSTGGTKTEVSPSEDKKEGLIDRKKSKLMEIENSIYIVLTLNENIGLDKIKVDGEVVDMTKVNTEGTILKYEISDRKNKKVEIEYMDKKDSITLKF